MGKMLMGVLVIILIAGIYLMLYSAIRISDIADQRDRKIRSMETFDKETQLITDCSCVQGGVAMRKVKNRQKMARGFRKDGGHEMLHNPDNYRNP